MTKKFNKLHEQMSDESKERVKEKLNELLSKITEDNLHSDVDFGKPVGKELI